MDEKPVVSNSGMQSSSYGHLPSLCVNKWEGVGGKREIHADIGRQEGLRSGSNAQAGATPYIFFLLSALLAVIGIADSRSTADDAATSVGAIVALIADSDQCCWPHIGVADHTSPIT